MSTDMEKSLQALQKEKEEIVLGFIMEKDIIEIVHRQELKTLRSNFEEEKYAMQREFELEKQKLLRQVDNQQVAGVERSQSDEEDVESLEKRSFSKDDIIIRLEETFQTEKQKITEKYEDIIAQKNSNINEILRDNDILRTKESSGSIEHDNLNLEFEKRKFENELSVMTQEHNLEIQKIKEEHDFEKTEIERRHIRDKAELVKNLATQTNILSNESLSKETVTEKEHRDEMKTKIEIVENLWNERNENDKKVLRKQHEREIETLCENITAELKVSLFEKENVIKDLEKENEELSDALQLERFALAKVYNRELSLVARADSPSEEDLEVALIDEVAKLRSEQQNALEEMEKRNKRKIKELKNSQKPLAEILEQHKKNIEELRHEYETEREEFEAKLRNEQLHLLKSFEFEKSDTERFYKKALENHEEEFQNEINQLRTGYESELEELKGLAGEVVTLKEQLQDERNKNRDLLERLGELDEEAGHGKNITVEDQDKSERALSEKLEELLKSNQDLTEQLQVKSEQCENLLEQIQKLESNNIVPRDSVETKEQPRERSSLSTPPGNVQRIRKAENADISNVLSKDIGSLERELFEKDTEIKQLKDQLENEKNDKQEVLEKLRDALSEVTYNEETGDVEEAGDVREKYDKLASVLNQQVSALGRMRSDEDKNEDGSSVDRGDTGTTFAENIHQLDDLLNDESLAVAKKEKDKLNERVKRVKKDILRSHELEVLEERTNCKKEKNRLLEELSNEKDRGLEIAVCLDNVLDELTGIDKERMKETFEKLLERKTVEEDANKQNSKPFTLDLLTPRSGFSDDSLDIDSSEAQTSLEQLRQDKEDLKRTIEELQSHFEKEKKDMHEKLQTQHKEYVLSPESEIIETLLKEKSALEELMNIERFYLSRVYYLEMKDELADILAEKTDEMKADFEKDKLDIALKHHNDISDLHQILADKDECEVNLLKEKNALARKVLALQSGKTPDGKVTGKEDEKEVNLKREAEIMEAVIPLKEEIADLQRERQEEHESSTAALERAVALIKDLLQDKNTDADTIERKRSFVSEDNRSSSAASSSSISSRSEFEEVTSRSVSVMAGSGVLSPDVKSKHPLSTEEIQSKEDLLKALNERIANALQEEEESEWDSSSGASSDLESGLSTPVPETSDEVEGIDSGAESAESDELAIKKSQLNLALNMERFSLGRVYYNEYKDSLRSALRKLAKAKDTLKNNKGELENSLLDAAQDIVTRTIFGKRSRPAEDVETQTVDESPDEAEMNSQLEDRQVDAEEKKKAPQIEDVNMKELQTEVGTADETGTTDDIWHDAVDQGFQDVRVEGSEGTSDDDDSLEEGEIPQVSSLRIAVLPGRPPSPCRFERLPQTEDGTTDQTAIRESSPENDSVYDIGDDAFDQSIQNTDESDSEEIPKKSSLQIDVLPESPPSPAPLEEHVEPPISDKRMGSLRDQDKNDKEEGKSGEESSPLDDAEGHRGVSDKRGPQTSSSEDDEVDRGVDDASEKDLKKNLTPVTINFISPSRERQLGEGNADITFEPITDKKEEKQDKNEDDATKLESSTCEDEEFQGNIDEKYEMARDMTNEKPSPGKNQPSKNQVKGKVPEIQEEVDEITEEDVSKSETDEKGNDIQDEEPTVGRDQQIAEGKRTRENVPINNETKGRKALDDVQLESSITSPTLKDVLKEGTSSESDSESTIHSDDELSTLKPKYQRPSNRAQEMTPDEHEGGKRLIEDHIVPTEESEALSAGNKELSPTHDGIPTANMKNADEIDVKSLIKENKQLNEKFNILRALVGKCFVDEIPELRSSSQVEEIEEEQQELDEDQLVELNKQKQALTEDIEGLEEKINALKEMSDANLKEEELKLDKIELENLKELEDVEAVLKADEEKDLIEHLIKERNEVGKKREEVKIDIEDQKGKISDEENRMLDLLAKRDELEETIAEQAKELAKKTKNLEAMKYLTVEKERLEKAAYALKMQQEALQGIQTKDSTSGLRKTDAEGDNEDVNAEAGTNADSEKQDNRNDKQEPDSKPYSDDVYLSPHVADLVKARKKLDKESFGLEKKTRRCVRDIERFDRMAEEQSSRLIPFLKKKENLEKTIANLKKSEGNRDELADGNDEYASQTGRSTLTSPTDTELIKIELRGIQSKIDGLYTKMPQSFKTDDDASLSAETEKLEREREQLEENIKEIWHGLPVDLEELLQEKANKKARLSRIELQLESSELTSEKVESMPDEAKEAFKLACCKADLGSMLKHNEVEIAQEGCNMLDAVEYQRKGKLQDGTTSRVRDLLEKKEACVNELKEVTAIIVGNINKKDNSTADTNKLEEAIERKIEIEDDIQHLQDEIDEETLRAPSALEVLLIKKSAQEEELHEVENSLVDARKTVQSRVASNNDYLSKIPGDVIVILELTATDSEESLVKQMKDKDRVFDVKAEKEKMMLEITSDIQKMKKRGKDPKDEEDALCAVIIEVGKINKELNLKDECIAASRKERKLDIIKSLLAEQEEINRQLKETDERLDTLLSHGDEAMHTEIEELGKLLEKKVKIEETLESAGDLRLLLEDKNRLNEALGKQGDTESTKATKELEEVERIIRQKTFEIEKLKVLSAEKENILSELKDRESAINAEVEELVVSTKEVLVKTQESLEETEQEREIYCRKVQNEEDELKQEISDIEGELEESQEEMEFVETELETLQEVDDHMSDELRAFEKMLRTKKNLRDYSVEIDTKLAKCDSAFQERLKPEEVDSLKARKREIEKNIRDIQEQKKTLEIELEEEDIQEQFMELCKEREAMEAKRREIMNNIHGANIFSKIAEEKNQSTENDQPNENEMYYYRRVLDRMIIDDITLIKLAQENEMLRDVSSRQRKAFENTVARLTDALGEDLANIVMMEEEFDSDEKHSLPKAFLDRMEGNETIGHIAQDMYSENERVREFNGEITKDLDAVKEKVGEQLVHALVNPKDERYDDDDDDDDDGHHYIDEVNRGEKTIEEILEEQQYMFGKTEEVLGKNLASSLFIPEANQKSNLEAPSIMKNTNEDLETVIAAYEKELGSLRHKHVVLTNVLGEDLLDAVTAEQPIECAAPLETNDESETIPQDVMETTVKESGMKDIDAGYVDRETSPAEDRKYLPKQDRKVIKAPELMRKYNKSLVDVIAAYEEDLDNLTAKLGPNLSKALLDLRAKRDDTSEAEVGSEKETVSKDQESEGAPEREEKMKEEENYMSDKSDFSEGMLDIRSKKDGAGQEKGTVSNEYESDDEPERAHNIKEEEEKCSSVKPKVHKEQRNGEDYPAHALQQYSPFREQLDPGEEQCDFERCSQILPVIKVIEEENITLEDFLVANEDQMETLKCKLGPTLSEALLTKFENIPVEETQSTALKDQYTNGGQNKTSQEDTATMENQFQTEKEMDDSKNKGNQLKALEVMDGPHITLEDVIKGYESDLDHIRTKLGPVLTDALYRKEERDEDDQGRTDDKTKQVTLSPTVEAMAEDSVDAPNQQSVNMEGEQSTGKVTLSPPVKDMAKEDAGSALTQEAVGSEGEQGTGQVALAPSTKSKGDVSVSDPTHDAVHIEGQLGTDDGSELLETQRTVESTEAVNQEKPVGIDVRDIQAHLQVNANDREAQTYLRAPALMDKQNANLGEVVQRYEESLGMLGAKLGSHLLAALLGEVTEPSDLSLITSAKDHQKGAKGYPEAENDKTNVKPSRFETVITLKRGAPVSKFDKPTKYLSQDGLAYHKDEESSSDDEIPSLSTENRDSNRGVDCSTIKSTEENDKQRNADVYRKLQSKGPYLTAPVIMDEQNATLEDVIKAYEIDLDILHSSLGPNLTRVILDSGKRIEGNESREKDSDSTLDEPLETTLDVTEKGKVNSGEGTDEEVMKEAKQETQSSLEPNLTRVIEGNESRERDTGDYSSLNEPLGIKSDREVNTREEIEQEGKEEVTREVQKQNAELDFEKTFGSGNDTKEDTVFIPLEKRIPIFLSKASTLENIMDDYEKERWDLRNKLGPHLFEMLTEKESLMDSSQDRKGEEKAVSQTADMASGYQLPQTIEIKLEIDENDNANISEAVHQYEVSDGKEGTGEATERTDKTHPETIDEEEVKSNGSSTEEDLHKKATKDGTRSLCAPDLMKQQNATLEDVIGEYEHDLHIFHARLGPHLAKAIVNRNAAGDSDAHRNETCGIGLTIENEKGRKESGYDRKNETVDEEVKSETSSTALGTEHEDEAEEKLAKDNEEQFPAIKAMNKEDATLEDVLISYEKNIDLLKSKLGPNLFDDLLQGDEDVLSHGEETIETVSQTADMTSSYHLPQTIDIKLEIDENDNAKISEAVHQYEVSDGKEGTGEATERTDKTHPDTIDEEEVASKSSLSEDDLRKKATIDGTQRLCAPELMKQHNATLEVVIGEYEHDLHILYARLGPNLAKAIVNHKTGGESDVDRDETSEINLAIENEKERKESGYGTKNETADEDAKSETGSTALGTEHEDEKEDKPAKDKEEQFPAIKAMNKEDATLEDVLISYERNIDLLKSKLGPNLFEDLLQGEENMLSHGKETTDQANSEREAHPTTSLSDLAKTESKDNNMVSELTEAEAPDIDSVYEEHDNIETEVLTTDSNDQDTPKGMGSPQSSPCQLAAPRQIIQGHVTLEEVIQGYEDDLDVLRSKLGDGLMDGILKSRTTGTTHSDDYSSLNEPLEATQDINEEGEVNSREEIEQGGKEGVTQEAQKQIDELDFEESIGGGNETKQDIVFIPMAKRIPTLFSNTSTLEKIMDDYEKERCDLKNKLGPHLFEMLTEKESLVDDSQEGKGEEEAVSQSADMASGYQLPQTIDIKLEIDKNDNAKISEAAHHYEVSDGKEGTGEAAERTDKTHPDTIDEEEVSSNGSSTEEDLRKKATKDELRILCAPDLMKQQNATLEDVIGEYEHDLHIFHARLGPHLAQAIVNRNAAGDTDAHRDETSGIGLTIENEKGRKESGYGTKNETAYEDVKSETGSTARGTEHEDEAEDKLAKDNEEQFPAIKAMNKEDSTLEDVLISYERNIDLLKSKLGPNLFHDLLQGDEDVLSHGEETIETVSQTADMRSGYHLPQTINIKLEIDENDNAKISEAVHHYEVSDGKEGTGEATERTDKTHPDTIDEEEVNSNGSPSEEVLRKKATKYGTRSLCAPDLMKQQNATLEDVIGEYEHDLHIFHARLGPHLAQSIVNRNAAGDSDAHRDKTSGIGLTSENEKERKESGYHPRNETADEDVISETGSTALGTKQEDEAEDKPAKDKEEQFLAIKAMNKEDETLEDVLISYERNIDMLKSKLGPNLFEDLLQGEENMLSHGEETIDQANSEREAHPTTSLSDLAKAESKDNNMLSEVRGLTEAEAPDIDSVHEGNDNIETDSNDQETPKGMGSPQSSPCQLAASQQMMRSNLTLEEVIQGYEDDLDVLRSKLGAGLMDGILKTRTTGSTPKDEKPLMKWPKQVKERDRQSKDDLTTDKVPKEPYHIKEGILKTGTAASTSKDEDDPIKLPQQDQPMLQKKQMDGPSKDGLAYEGKDKNVDVPMKTSHIEKDTNKDVDDMMTEENEREEPTATATDNEKEQDVIDGETLHGLRAIQEHDLTLEVVMRSYEKELDVLKDKLGPKLAKAILSESSDIQHCPDKSEDGQLVEMVCDENDDHQTRLPVSLKTELEVEAESQMSEPGLMTSENDIDRKQVQYGDQQNKVPDVGELNVQDNRLNQNPEGSRRGQPDEDLHLKAIQYMNTEGRSVEDILEDYEHKLDTLEERLGQALFSGILQMDTDQLQEDDNMEKGTDIKDEMDVEEENMSEPGEVKREFQKRDEQASSRQEDKDFKAQVFESLENKEQKGTDDWTDTGDQEQIGDETDSTAMESAQDSVVNDGKALKVLKIMNDKGTTLQDVISDYETIIEEKPSSYDEDKLRDVLSIYENELEDLKNENNSFRNKLGEDLSRCILGFAQDSDLPTEAENKLVEKENKPEAPYSGPPVKKEGRSKLVEKENTLEASKLLEEDGNTLGDVIKSYERELKVLREMVPEEGEVGVPTLAILSDYGEQIDALERENKDLKRELDDVESKLGVGLLKQLSDIGNVKKVDIVDGDNLPSRQDEKAKTTEIETTSELADQSELEDKRKDFVDGDDLHSRQDRKARATETELADEYELEDKRKEEDLEDTIGVKFVDDRAYLEAPTIMKETDITLEEVLRSYEQQLAELIKQQEGQAHSEHDIEMLKEKIGPELFERLLCKEGDEQSTPKESEVEGTTEENVDGYSENEVIGDKTVSKILEKINEENKSLSDIISDYETMLATLQNKNDDMEQEYADKMMELESEIEDLGYNFQQLSTKLRQDLVDNLIRQSDPEDELESSTSQVQALKIMEMENKTLADVVEDYEEKMRKLEHENNILKAVTGESEECASILETVSEYEETIDNLKAVNKVQNEQLEALTGNIGKELVSGLIELSERSREENDDIFKEDLQERLPVIQKMEEDGMTLEEVIQHYEETLKTTEKELVSIQDDLDTLCSTIGQDLSNEILNPMRGETDLKDEEETQRDIFDENTAGEFVGIVEPSHKTLQEKIGKDLTTELLRLDATCSDDLKRSQKRPHALLKMASSSKSLEEIVNEYESLLLKQGSMDLDSEMRESVAIELQVAVPEDEIKIEVERQYETGLGVDLTGNDFPDSSYSSDELHTKIEKLEKELEEERELSEKYQKDIEDLLNDIVKLKMRNIGDDEVSEDLEMQLKEDLEVKQENKRLKEELDEMKDAIKKMDDENFELKTEIKNMEQEIKKLEKALEDLQKQLGNAEKSSKLDAEVEELKRRNLELENEIEGLKEQLKEIQENFQTEKENLIQEKEEEKIHSINELLSAKGQVEIKLQEQLFANNDLEEKVKDLENELKEKETAIAGGKEDEDEEKARLKQRNESLKEQLDESEAIMKDTIEKYQEEIKTMEKEGAQVENTLKHEIDLLQNKLELEKASGERLKNDFDDILKREKERLLKDFESDLEREKRKIENEKQDAIEECEKKERKIRDELESAKEKSENEKREMQGKFDDERKTLQESFEDDLRKKNDEYQEMLEKLKEELEDRLVTEKAEMNIKFRNETSELQSRLETQIYGDELQKKIDLEKNFQETLNKLLQDHAKEIESIEGELQKAEERFQAQKLQLLQEFEKEKEGIVTERDQERQSLESTIQNLLKEIIKLKQQRKEMRQHHRLETQGIEDLLEKEREDIKENMEKCKLELLEKMQKDHEQEMANEKEKYEEIIQDLQNELTKTEAKRKDLEDYKLQIELFKEKEGKSSNDSESTDSDAEFNIKTVRRSLEFEYEQKLSGEKQKFDDTLQGLRKEVGNLQEKRKIIQQRVYNQESYSTDRHIIEKSIANYKMEVLSKLEEEMNNRLAREKKPLEEEVRELQTENEELKHHRWEMKVQFRREKVKLEEEFEQEKEKLEIAFGNERDEFRKRWEERVQREQMKKHVEEVLTPRGENADRMLKQENLLLSSKNERLEMEIENVMGKMQAMESNFVQTERIKVERMRKIQEQIPKKVNFPDQLASSRESPRTGNEDGPRRTLQEKDVQIQHLLETKRFYESVFGELCDEAVLFEVDGNQVV